MRTPVAQRRRRVVVGLVAVVSLAALCVVAALQPPIANRFGYALPGAHGLPGQFSYQSVWYYDLAVCGDLECTSGAQTRVAQNNLASHGEWPMRQVATLPTLFGAGRPIYELAYDPSMLGAGGPYVGDIHPFTLYIDDPDAPGWYYVYERPGGP